MSDTYFDDVSLLLHFNGSDGSTTFTDNSSLAHTVTAVGNAQLDDQSPKFGSASLLLDGTGDYATIPYHADLHLSTGDFTIECWVRASTSNNSRNILHLGRTSNNDTAWELAITSGGYLQFNARDDSGNSVFPTQSSGGGYTDGTWHHIAATREGNTFRIFRNGTLLDTKTSSMTIRAAASSPNYILCVGALAGGTSAWNGRIDDLRITAGVARYTASFTAPTAEFPDTGPTPEGSITAPGVLQAPALLATASAGFVAAAGVLQAPQALAAQSRALIAADGPLQAAQALASLRNGVIAADSPLQAPAALGGQFRAWMSAAGPLGVPELLATQIGGAVQAPSLLDSDQAQAQAHHLAAFVAADSPLGAARLLASNIAGHMAAASPLGIGRAVAWHDFTGQVDPDAPQRYLMDLLTPSGTVRVPISSWQATLQSGAANYLQCVIPNAGAWTAEIAAATEFVISRASRTADGGWVEYLMARAPVQSLQDARGPTSRTVTLSGYTDAFAAVDNPSIVFDRRMRNVRQIFVGGGLRARADIDWLLRPGMRAYVDDTTPIVVRFINIYVTSAGDSYCDVGSSA